MGLNRISPGRLACVALIAGSLAAGCADEMRRRELERVAKGWCETIRASQVIPVYPLTEDLRPGDVFLVQTSMSEEASRYRARGFLPLDDYRERLDLGPDAYHRMYFDGYWKDQFGSVPNARPTRTAGAFPSGASGATGSSGSTGASGGTGSSGGLPSKAGTAGASGVSGADPAALLSEANAPRAAFPTYTFDVSSQQGLGLALPIHGVPVALSLMHADRATGSVQIADARTYGADPSVVLGKLSEWSQRPDIKPCLADAARNSPDPVFLRVVTRVYLTGAVNVSLTRRSSLQGDVGAGNAPDLKLINESGQAVESANRQAGSLAATGSSGATGSTSSTAGSSGAGSGALPGTGVPGASGAASELANIGGRFKFTTMTASSVSMVEMFDTLLVIGYLGLDVPVYEDGSIGLPVPTFQKIDRMVYPAQERRADEARYLEQVDLVMAGSGKANEVTRDRLLRTMRGVSTRLSGEGFGPALNAIRAAESAPDEQKAAAFALAGEAFRKAANSYIVADGDARKPVRTTRFSAIFDDEFNRTRPQSR